eukprot:1161151-Pelagomonas_calceolata.AAC.9
MLSISGQQLTVLPQNWTKTIHFVRHGEAMSNVHGEHQQSAQINLLQGTAPAIIATGLMPICRRRGGPSSLLNVISELTPLLSAMLAFKPDSA